MEVGQPSFGRMRMFAPLRIRDFALLWTGMTVSLLGDGIYLVAIAWQVYELSNAPMALSIVGIAWTVPQVALVLFGGAISDRVSRRLVMIVADAVRGAAIGVVGLLSVADALQLWHLVVLVAFYGGASALFTPAFTAVVPELVPADQLIQANALDSVVRPLTIRLAGPAFGGWLIAAVGAGGAFLVDAGTFSASLVALLMMRTRSLPIAAAGPRPTLLRDVREGLSYVRSHTWLAGTLLAVTAVNLFFLGPVYVLMPFVVKNGLGSGSEGLGFVFAAGGAGAIVASLTIGHRGTPRRPFTLLYLAWAGAGLGLVGYGVATELWHALLVSFVSVALLSVGGIIWTSLLQRLVPNRLLGRVSSLDWLLSFGLAPVSYALTGPVAELIGVERTLMQAGLISAGVLVVAYLFLPELRALERRELPRARLT